MASKFVVCVLFALAAEGAVLDTQDTLLRRIARSPSCDKCSEHPELPPPPPPFGPPPPPLGSPPPEPHSGSAGQARSFKEAESSNQQVEEFKKNTFISGSTRSASSQAVSGASSFNKHGSKNGFEGSNKKLGSGFQNNAASSAQAVSGAAGGFNRYDSKNGFTGNNKNLGSGDQNNAASSAQAVSAAGGFNKHDSTNGFIENHENLESGFQNNGFEAGSSASEQAVSGAGGFNKHDSKNGFTGNYENRGSEFQKTRFEAGSSASTHGVSEVGVFHKHDGENGFTRNHESGFQKNGFEVGSSASAHAASGVAGFNAGIADSAQASRSAAGDHNLAYKDRFTEKQNVGGAVQQNGQTVDALKSANQAGKQGCSSCAKGGSAVSNAKSNSGAATAIAVNNG